MTEVQALIRARTAAPDLPCLLVRDFTSACFSKRQKGFYVRGSIGLIEMVIYWVMIY